MTLNLDVWLRVPSPSVELLKEPMSDVANLYAFQWIWEGHSQLAEDSYVNTWHFRKASGIVTDFDNVKDMLVEFYTGNSGATRTDLTNWMTVRSLTGKWTIKAYHLTDPKPRSPVYEATGAVNLNTDEALPTEVALVMSFQAEPVSGENQKRKRNRIYLGPFGQQILGSTLTVDGTVVESILFAGKALYEASEASANWHWNVYSPTDDEAYEVYNGWCDNGYDTQRRRGTRSTARGYFDNTQPT